jgi:Protein of unknown function (DUF3106)
VRSARVTELAETEMREKAKFAIAMVALCCAAVPDGWAQKPNAHPDRPPARQNAPQPQMHTPPPRAQNPNVNRPQGQAIPHPPNNGVQNNFNNQNGVRNGTGAVFSPRQQLGVGAARPWVDRMRELSPQQREHVMQNSRAFQNLSPDKQSKIRQQFNQWDRMTPQQQSSLRQNEDTWRRLTPEQRDHIKNDVLPRWRQMPWDRQQVMKQKLSVLQNMPESARNERLNDPNFTRGMSDEEKSTLHDLSHLHVGGSPEAPPEQ